ncbi:MAG: HEAT repeat domain-containing protein [Planctomycetes bacterium]|nr:HEAT repeat domain-containing protein [Planctomycetota bacterium]
MKTLLSLASGLGLMLVVVGLAWAHGGTYRGPGGIGSPGGIAGPQGTGSPGPGPGPAGTGTGSGGGDTGGGNNGGSTGGGAVGPVRGGSPGGGAPGGAGLGSGGGSTKAKKVSNNSAATWDAWWFHNDDRFLNLKSRLRERAQDTDTGDLFMGNGGSDSVVRVTAKKIRDRVNPALEFALDDPHYDSRAAAVIALGKTGYEANLGHILATLADDDHRVRESACLALGILGNRAAVPVLIEIMQDSALGQEKLGRGRQEIFIRTRSFAALALGLIGSRTDISDTPAEAALLGMLKKRSTHRDLAVAPVIALGLMKAKDTVPALMQFAADEDQDAWTRAYAITTLAKLGDPAAKDLLLESLRDKQNAVVQSAAMGLGLLVSSDDHRAIRRLHSMIKSGRDLAAKNFAIISLGQIGGAANRNYLARLIDKGNSFEHTFAAMALATYFSEPANANDPEKIEICRQINREFKNTKNPDERGAYAIALGIMDYDDAGTDLRAALEQGGSAKLRSHLCLSLGLMRFEAAMTSIQETMKEKSDIGLRRSAAVALGLMGDQTAVAQLKSEIADSANSQAVHGAVVQGLGLIGDVSAVDTLADMVFDRVKNQGATRAYAAAALGLLGDKDEIGVLSRLSENSNYLLATDATREVYSIL